MSSVTYFGTNAGFYYYRPGATTWESYPIAVPLREPRPSYRVAQYVAESLDYSRRQVLEVEGSASTGVFEILATIRYDDTQASLMNVLKYGILQSDSTAYPFRYTTTLTTGTTAGAPGPGADVLLVDYGAPFDVPLDRQRANFGDLEVQVRLRALSTAGFSTASGATWF